MFGFKKVDFEPVRNHYEKILKLEMIYEHLLWDQETCLPPKGASTRGKIVAELLEEVNLKIKDDSFLKNFADIDPAKLKGVDLADYNIIKTKINYSQKVPKELLIALGEKKAEVFSAWRQARNLESTKDYIPVLGELIALKIQEASSIREGPMTNYDALLNQYEPKANTIYVNALVRSLKPKLISVRDQAILSQGDAPTLPSLDESIQWRILKNMVSTMGLKDEFTRIDITKTPFTAGYFDDVRIGAKIYPDIPLKTFQTSMHLVGTATYEHHVSRDLMFRASGKHASNGCVHAMGYLLKFHFCQSYEFLDYLQKEIAKLSPDWHAISAEQLQATITVVKPDLISGRSDELNQVLHNINRFEIEKDLINGDMHVDQLEEEYSKRTIESIGLKPTTPLDGILQDTHWAIGHFGMFSSAILGRIYAAAIYDEMRHEIEDIGDLINAGNNQIWIDHLANKFMKFGAQYSGEELITNITGMVPNLAALNNYLDKTYLSG